jgi:pimeloyl-ACP methyl ester carboxylesterase
MTYQEAWVDRGGHRIYAREYPGQEPAIVPVVVHDAAGPPGIDWALEHPDRVAGLVLLNTYYCHMPGLRSPEAIWLFPPRWSARSPARSRGCSATWGFGACTTGR